MDWFVNPMCMITCVCCHCFSRRLKKYQIIVWFISVKSIRSFNEYRTCNPLQGLHLCPLGVMTLDINSDPHSCLVHTSVFGPLVDSCHIRDLSPTLSLKCMPNDLPITCLSGPIPWYFLNFFHMQWSPCYVIPLSSSSPCYETAKVWH